MLRAAALGAAGTLILAAGAGAAPRQSTVSAADAVARGCHERAVTGARGTDTTRFTAAATGILQARLKGRGDWDLGVFDARSKRSVAGAAGFGSSELAESFVRKGQRLVVQACRYRGSARSARLSVTVLPVKLARASSAEKVQLVEVSTETAADKRRLQGLGLDLTEHGDATSVDAVLHGRADAEKLRANGFRYQVEVADLAAQSRTHARRNRAFAAATAATDLPSGRDEYRRLADYELELKELSLRYPGLTRPITLNHETIEGRQVNGIEITRNADFVNDGKPIFLNMGVHHAREWPSSEHAMEFAYDLLTSYGESDRTTRLVNDTRTIVVPIVNPDGFNISREAEPIGNFGLFDYEMKRKNCRVSASTPAVYTTGTCDDNNAGRLRGTDPNRNYGGIWGGGGASTFWGDDTFRGDGPFSEPETQNIRDLHSTRNITNLITNHTFSNLLLRPPGVASFGFSPDEPLYKALGRDMALHNRYANIPSYGLYDTTGGTEDWTYWTAGSLGFTFEIGIEGFHPPFERAVVGEYLGRDPAQGAGLGGNQAAYYEMLEATDDEAYHSVLTGKAPAGWTVKAAKTVQTQTSPVWQNDAGTVIGDPISFEDRLEYTLDSRGGKFAFHVNPSTRPVVAGRYGVEATAPPQADATLVNPPGFPDLNPYSNHYSEGDWEDTTFEVQGPPGADNGTLDVHVEWTDPDVDWDIFVLDPDGNLQGSSASFGDNDEDVTVAFPTPGTWTVRVVNWDQGDDRRDDPALWDDWSGTVSFGPPPAPVAGTKEAWTVTCERHDGQVRSRRQVVVDRGETVDLGNACKK